MKSLGDACVNIWLKPFKETIPGYVQVQVLFSSLKDAKGACVSILDSSDQQKSSLKMEIRVIFIIFPLSPT